jgi:putative inorganic carbon (hco3(-)) transporter
MGPDKLKTLKFTVLVLACIVWTTLANVAMAWENRTALIVLLGFGPALILAAYLVLDPDNFLYAIIFFVPLSLQQDLPGGFTISFPAEAMAVLLILYSLANIGRIKVPDRRIFAHPVFLILVVQVGWMVVTTATSTIPLVSMKRTIIQILYIFIFFFLFLTRFTSPAAILRFYGLYTLGLVVPILHGFIWHAQYSFSQQSSYYMPQPFYIEHTLYGATLAFVIPVIFYLALVPSPYNRRKLQRVLFRILLLLCILAEFFAYSRAAWMSLLMIPFFLLVFRYRIRIRYLLAAGAVFGIVLALNTTALMDYLGRNEASSNRGNLKEQVESVSNIQSDISNLERINRWKCAFRMFREKPLTGFGPGTYQFEYGRFQVKREMTRISTYHGEKGNAHSEYLGSLAETGIPGLVIYLSVMIIVLYHALRVIYRTHDRQIRALAVTITVCLLPFWFHTIFNAFIDTDEIGSLYYGSVAAITALDLYFFRNPIQNSA